MPWDLDREREGYRGWTRTHHGPAAADDVQLAVDELCAIGQQHLHLGRMSGRAQGVAGGSIAHVALLMHC